MQGKDGTKTITETDKRERLEGKVEDLNSKINEICNHLNIRLHRFYRKFEVKEKSDPK